MLKPTCQAEGCGRKIPQTEKHNNDFGSWCEQCSNLISRRLKERARINGELKRKYSLAK